MTPAELRALPIVIYERRHHHQHDTAFDNLLVRSPVTHSADAYTLMYSAPQRTHCLQKSCDAESTKGSSSPIVSCHSGSLILVAISAECCRAPL